MTEATTVPGFSRWKLLDKVVAGCFVLWSTFVVAAGVIDPSSAWLLDLSEGFASHLASLTMLTKVWAIVASILGCVSLVGVCLGRRRPMALTALCALFQVVGILHSVAQDHALWPALGPPALFGGYYTMRFWMREMVPKYR